MNIIFILLVTRLENLGRLTRPLITCPLVSIALFGWPAVLLGPFVLERTRLALILLSLSLGAAFGFIIGMAGHSMIKDIRGRGQTYPDGNETRLNACLLDSVLALVVGWQFVYWLTWDLGPSAGIAVTNDREDGIWVDFYGRAVSPGVVKIAFDKHLAPGGLEWTRLFGVPLHRGFIPNDDRPGRGPGRVSRIAFHRTRVDDSVIPILKQFTGLLTLGLRNTRITANGVRQLQQALPTCEILHESTNNVDVWWPHTILTW